MSEMCTYQVVPTKSFLANRPLEVVAVDFTALEPAFDGMENVLVVTDVFTKLTQVFPTRDPKADTTAEVLLRDWFMRYGVPERLHSVQERNFESEVIQKLCWLYGLKKTHATEMQNVSILTERFMTSYTCCYRKKKHCWPEYLPELVDAFNVTPLITTGYSLYNLMFGLHPHLPVDVLL